MIQYTYISRGWCFEEERPSTDVITEGSVEVGLVALEVLQPRASDLISRNKISRCRTYMYNNIIRLINQRLLVLGGGGKFKFLASV